MGYAPTGSVLTSRGAVVVATMRGVERDKFTPLGEVRHPQFAALERFSPVQVRDDDPTENARLAGAAKPPNNTHLSSGSVGGLPRRRPPSPKPD